MTKTERVILYTQTAYRPYSVHLLMEHAQCSKQTVSRALHKSVFVTFWSWTPNSNGVFSRVFFPSHWSEEKCMEWVKGQPSPYCNYADIHTWGLPF